MEYVTLSGEMRDSMNHYYIGCLKGSKLDGPESQWRKCWNIPCDYSGSTI